MNDINLTHEMKKWVSRTERVIKAIENKINSNSQEMQKGNFNQNYNKLEENRKSHPLNDRLALFKLELENAKFNLQIILDENERSGVSLGGSKRKSKQTKRKSKQTKKKSNKNKKSKKVKSRKLKK